MLSTVATADTYFSKNFFGGDAWDAIDDDVKESLLNTAELDINGYLKCFRIATDCVNAEEPFTTYQMAIFEWALFIYQNKEDIQAMQEQKAFGVLSAKVDGLGQESYGSLGNQTAAYRTMMTQSRAGQYLLSIATEQRIIR